MCIIGTSRDGELSGSYLAVPSRRISFISSGDGPSDKSESLHHAASVIPHERLLSIDERFANAAAKPVIIPETINCDRGKVYLSETFLRACMSLGISVQPARPYTGSDKVRARGDQIPYIIYASSRAPGHIAEARRHGAIGCTNSATELVGIVSVVLIRNVPTPRFYKT